MKKCIHFLRKILSSQRKLNIFFRADHALKNSFSSFVLIFFIRKKMMKVFSSIFKSRFMCSEGSALLVTLILMAALMILGLGFGKLIIDAIRLEYDVVQAGKAYYHAESGLEEALFVIDRHLPGYEVFQAKGDANGDGKSDYSYSIRALSSSSGNAVPCNFDEKEDAPWQKLKLNDSFTLPLFRADSQFLSFEDKIQNFRIEYYLGAWPSGASENISALRWKIFGQTSGGETQAISRYVPVLENFNSASNPANFGTSLFGSGGEITNGDSAQFRDCSDGICVFYENYSIATFLSKHEHNFIVLTNVLNFSQALSDDETILYARLVEDQNDPLVCNFVRIEADGAADNIDAPLQLQQYTQNLNIDISLNDFLPVFDFALYRTTSL